MCGHSPELSGQEGELPEVKYWNKRAVLPRNLPGVVVSKHCWMRTPSFQQARNGLGEGDRQMFDSRSRGTNAGSSLSKSDHRLGPPS